LLVFSNYRPAETSGTHVLLVSPKIHSLNKNKLYHKPPACKIVIIGNNDLNHDCSLVDSILERNADSPGRNSVSPYKYAFSGLFPIMSNIRIIKIIPGKINKGIIIETYSKFY